MRRDQRKRGPYGVAMTQGANTPGRAFAELIKAARLRALMSQEDLADAAGVGRYTINRWESGKTPHPQAEAVRKVLAALPDLDPREVPIALGYVTREEMGIPPRVVDPMYADVIDMLADPNVPARDKEEWAEYLRWQHNRSQPGRPQKGTPRGTQKATPTRSAPR
jgi:transcriptional regulator with XRE-family HTH domain